MIISLFRTSHPASYLLLPIIGVLLRIPLLFVDVSNLDSLSYFEFAIVSRPWLNMLVAGVLSGLFGVYINYLSDQFGFLDRVSGLAGLSFVLLSIWSSESASFSFSYISLGIFLFAFQQLLSLGKLGGVAQVFNASLLISLATFFTPEMVVFQLLVPLAIVYFQTIQWRHFTVWLIGFTLPCVYLLVWNMCQPSTIQNNSIYPFEIFSATNMIYFQTANWLWQLIFFLLVVTLAMQSFRKGLTNNTTRIRKSFFLIIWTLLLGIMALLLTDSIQTAPYLFVALPVGFMLSNYLFYSKKRVLSETAFIGIAIIELVNYWL